MTLLLLLLLLQQISSLTSRVSRSQIRTERVADSAERDDRTIIVAWDSGLMRIREVLSLLRLPGSDKSSLRKQNYYTSAH